MYRHLRSTLLGRLRSVDLKSYKLNQIRTLEVPKMFSVSKTMCKSSLRCCRWTAQQSVSWQRCFNKAEGSMR